MEKRDFAGLELGPPDISIQNVEARPYFVVVLFWGGGWLGATRPSDTHDHHDMTLVRLHLRMQTNLLSFANESVCITMPVFSLQ